MKTKIILVAAVLGLMLCGHIKLEAPSGGSTYLVKLEGGKAVAQLKDPDEENPTAAFRKPTTP